MASLDQCPACGGEHIQVMTSAGGARAYCLTCFHGWRTERRVYDYSGTAMYPDGTSAERLASQIAFFAPFVSSAAHVLELGCATAELAPPLREVLAPARYEAIELSPAGEKARDLVDKLHVQPLGDLLAAGAIEPGFDLVIMSHLLEHLEDPAGELDAIRRVMNPEGVLFLEVPNRSGNRRLPIDDNRAHLQFFSATSLGRMLAGQGLEIVATQTGAWVDSRCSDALRVAARAFRVPALNSPFLSDHPRLAADGKIVVWGAGSLAEDMLANWFDPARIDYFIDRSPSKQGTLCLGRPVRGPEALGETPRTVLAASIDFAPAIAADIARLYPGVGHRVIPVGDLLA